MLKVATATPNEPYREYKDVERVYSGSTEIDKILDKNGNVLFAVNKEVEGTPALTYKGKEETNLKNYRIYGQTVDGESVGDRTGNLWDETIIQGGTNNAGTIADGNPKRLRSDYIFVEPGETYSFASNLKIRLIYSYDDNNQRVSLIRDAPNGDISYTFTVPNAATKIIITVMKRINNVEYDITPDDFEWGQLEKGSVVTSYEPYGYRVPVTVEGKNLFDENTLISPIGSLSWYFDNHYLMSNSSSGDGRTWTYDKSQFKFLLSPGTYCLSFDIPISETTRIFSFIMCDDNNTEILFDDLKNRTSYSKSFTINNNTNIGIVLKIPSNIKIRIMLNTGSTPLPYEPYHAPITTPIYLPEPIKMVGDEAEYIDYAEQKQHRVRKNLLQNTAMSRTLSTGITVTVNDNKSVVINGTSNTGNASGIVLGGNVILDKGAYILSGCPQGGSNDTYKLICIFNDNGERKVLTDNGDGATIVLNGDNPEVIDNGFYIYALSCDNNVFFPMLRKASIEDDTYEPYIENSEVDVTLPALPTLPGTNTLTVGTEVQPSNVYMKGRIKEIM